MKPAQQPSSPPSVTAASKGESLWARHIRELGAAAQASRRPGVQGRWKGTHRVSLHA